MVWANLRRAFMRNWDVYEMSDDPFEHNSIAQNIAMTVYTNLSRSKDAATLVGILKPLSRNETVALNEPQKQGLRNRIEKLF